MENLKGFRTYIIVALSSLILGIAIGFMIDRSGIKKTNIKWKFGENELELNLDQDLADASAMLKKLFSEGFSKNGTLVWLKENQKLFSPGDPDLVPQISSLKYDNLVSSGLRDLSIRRKGPWAYQYDTVQIGIPSAEDQPKEGYANVCETGDYFNQKLRIMTLDQTKDIEVTGTGRYECPEGLQHPDIQLNVNDAQKLFGTNSLMKYQKGIVLILRD